jgi:Fur family peroxide stress response transcriptional regulator
MRKIRNYETSATEAVVDIDRKCRDFEASCRRRGIRLTPQRLAVYRALVADLSHPTAEALYASLALVMPGLSQATVYRTLEFLDSENLIRRVSGPETVGRFDANLERHQHLVCRTCGSLIDVTVSEFDGLKLPRFRGFSVEEMDIRLVGRCGDCAGSRTVPSRGSDQTRERKVKHG